MLVPIPDLTGARRVLCVQPHYDDNDLGAGGTVGRLAAEGAEVVYLTVADDLVGVLDPDLSEAAALEVLKSEQEAAGRIVGVGRQRRLDWPDAGRWDELELRRQIAGEIRRFRPDVVLTVDPWLSTEAHRDHVRTGFAVLEAVLLHGLPRFSTGEPEIDAGWSRGCVEAVGLYFTARPNTWIDVGATASAKHRAIDCYAAQLDADALRVIHAGLEAKEREWGARAGCERAEALRVLHPAHLHCNPDAEAMEV